MWYSSLAFFFQLSWISSREIKRNGGKRDHSGKINWWASKSQNEASIGQCELLIVKDVWPGFLTFAVNTIEENYMLTTFSSSRMDKQISKIASVISTLNTGWGRTACLYFMFQFFILEKVPCLVDSIKYISNIQWLTKSLRFRRIYNPKQLKVYWMIWQFG